MSLGANDHSLQSAYASLSAQARPDGQAAVYAFVSPQTGCGTSYVARSMAMIAANNMQQGGQVLLVDMDLQGNAQSAYFFSPESQTQYGAPQGPYDATMGADPFWRVTPFMVNADGQSISDNHFMSMHLLPGAPLAFTHFHWETFKPGQNVQVQNARSFWQNARARFSAIFVDTPALDRSDVLGAICPEADTSILISSQSRAQDLALKDAMGRIQASGGRCAGVILNDGPAGGYGYGGSA